MPRLKGTNPAATAAAEPADEPPGVCRRLRGLRVGAGSRKAKGVVAVLPRIVAPARLTADTTAASALGRQPA